MAYRHDDYPRKREKYNLDDYPRRRRSRPARSHKTVRASSGEITRRVQARSSQPSAGGLFSAKIVIAFFFLFVFVYIGRSIWVFWTPTVDTMTLRMSTIDVPMSATGVIIRDEQVFLADSDGHIEFRIPDNERVRVGAVVASVQDSYMVNAATVRLTSVESQIMDIQDRRISSVDTEIQRLNNNLGNIANTRIHNFATLNLSEIYSTRDSLNQVINTRNQININDGVTARENLAREQERHSNAYQYNSRNMYAHVSGIMSRVIDGYESQLTMDLLNTITRDDARMIVDFDSVTSTRDIQEGDAAFKIVGNIWYIAADMPNEMVQGFVESTTRTVYLFNANTNVYEPHSLQVQSIEYGTRYSLVVFRSSRHVIEFLNQRNVSIRTASNASRGLKIPHTAIATERYYMIPSHYIHGIVDRYVVISNEGGDISIPITISEADDGIAFVLPATGLGIGSLLVPRDPSEPHILLSTEHIHEIHGIYLVRFGAAEFREVNIGSNYIDVGYILLDPVLNPGINEFANIVTDASMVVDGQLLR